MKNKLKESKSKLIGKLKHRKEIKKKKQQKKKVGKIKRRTHKMSNQKRMRSVIKSKSLLFLVGYKILLKIILATKTVIMTVNHNQKTALKSLMIEWLKGLLKASKENFSEDSQMTLTRSNHKINKTLILQRSLISK